MCRRCSAAGPSGTLPTTAPARSAARPASWRRGAVAAALREQGGVNMAHPHKGAAREGGSTAPAAGGVGEGGVVHVQATARMDMRLGRRPGCRAAGTGWVAHTVWKACRAGTSRDSDVVPRTPAPPHQTPSIIVATTSASRHHHHHHHRHGALCPDVPQAAFPAPAHIHATYMVKPSWFSTPSTQPDSKQAAVLRASASKLQHALPHRPSWAWPSSAKTFANKKAGGRRLQLGRAEQ